MKHGILLFAFVFLYLLGSSQSKNFIDQPYIEVSGQADTLLTPNEIFIKIVISENDNKGRVSLEEMENQMLTEFRKLGISPETNLTMVNMVSNFRQYLLKRPDVFKTKEYMLKVSKAKLAAEALSALQGLSIANVSVDRVSHSNLDEIVDLVRKKAMENAKNTAIMLASSIQQGVGPALHIEEMPDLNNMLQGRVAGIVVAGYSMSAAKEREWNNIDFDQIKISKSVQVKFILK